MKNIIVFSLVILGIIITNIFTGNIETSKLERRGLSQFEPATFESLANGEFSKSFSEYVSDQFPNRDSFRGLKTFIQVNIFKRIDNNSVYIIDDNIVGKFEEINYSLVDNHIKNINRIIEAHNNNVYLSLIPSKAYGVDVPGINQDNLASYIANNINAEYLKQLDYYKANNAFLVTDPHWKQGDSLNIYNQYLKEHLIKRSDKYDYNVERLPEPYLGTLYSNLGTGKFSDYLEVYTNETIEALNVCVNNGFEEKCTDGPYFESENLYDIYLSGNNPVVTIYNDSVSTGELIVFRDSFSNAIAPFIAEDFHKVTFIDLRLVRIEYINEIVDFTNADILFMYSLQMLNDDYRLTN